VSTCGEYELATCPGAILNAGKGGEPLRGVRTIATCSGAVLKAALGKLAWLVSQCGENKLATCAGAIHVLKAAFRYWQGWCYLLWCYTEGDPQILARLVLPALVLY
jgi:hypothetical protein